MTTTAVDRDLGRARALLDAAADGGCAGVEVVLEDSTDGDVVEAVGELEVLGRRVAALQVAVLDQIQQRGLHHGDGHGSAKAMVRHLGRLSGAEAAGRDRARRALELLPAMKASYTAGEVGTDQVRLLGRVWANPRVRYEMTRRDEVFVEQAQNLDYVDFEASVRRWERLVDRDGSDHAADQAHEHRDFTMTQDPFGLGWELRGGCGPLAGAAIEEIFNHYLQAEWETDWDKARAEHGEQASVEDLPRSAAQRRADALYAIFEDAAATPPGSNRPRFVHNIVWNAQSYEQMLRELDPGITRRLDPDTFRCETLDGVALAPTEALHDSLINQIRRVVIDAAGVVIDLSTARRFTGSARLAAQLGHNRCRWKGCWKRVTDCEIDHLTPHSHGGQTNPANAAPLCGHHNRWKQKGYTVWRDPTGHWHTHHPDGTEIQ